ncbi:MAG TPA: hypothetical protein VLC09_17095, partial [Polyangiaceae bacterium]|nr:hypothetical protein [Polyangiaceae bacterium]
MGALLLGATFGAGLLWRARRPSSSRPRRPTPRATADPDPNYFPSGVERDEDRIFRLPEGAIFDDAVCADALNTLGRIIATRKQRQGEEHADLLLPLCFLIDILIETSERPMDAQDVQDVRNLIEERLRIRRK